MPSLRLAARLLPPPALLLAAAAQVPPGAVVYGHRADPLHAIVGGGITVVDPVAGSFRPVGNLPAELLQPGSPRPAGVGCVQVRDADGALFASCASPLPGAPFCIWQLELDAALAVRQAQAFPVGVATAAAAVLQMDWLADGRLVFVHRGFGDRSDGIAILDPGSGAVQAVAWPLVGLGPPAAVAALRDQQLLLVGIDNLSGPLFLVDPAAAAAIPQHLATLPRGIVALAVDHRSGHVTAALRQHSVYDVDLTRNPPYLRPLSPQQDVCSLGVERAAGRLCVLSPTVFGGYCQWLDPTSRAWQPLAGTFPAQSPTAVACRASLQQYGDGALADAGCEWLVEGNPGGAPTAGNGGFSVTLRSAAALPGLLLLGWRDSAPLSATVPELHNVLIDLGSLVHAAMLPAPTSSLVSAPPGLLRTTIALPLPPALPPTRLCAQVLHFAAGGGLFGSPGLLIHAH